ARPQAADAFGVSGGRLRRPRTRPRGIAHEGGGARDAFGAQLRRPRRPARARPGARPPRGSQPVVTALAHRIRLVAQEFSGWRPPALSWGFTLPAGCVPRCRCTDLLACFDLCANGPPSGPGNPAWALRIAGPSGVEAHGRYLPQCA